MKLLRLLSVGLAAVALNGCREQSNAVTSNSAKLSSSDGDNAIAKVSSRRSQKNHPQLLSEYKLFRGELAKLEKVEGVIEYDLNTPLFSDYSFKNRVIRLPDGTSAKYDPKEAFDFPVGTIISKTFYYPHDMTDASRGRRLIETRILRRDENGWIGLPYVWNDEQTDAALSLAGAAVEVQWVHHDGTSRTNTHLVPNLNDCKRCHQNEIMAPLGPTARNLNRNFEYPHGSENQLANWTRTGFLTGVKKQEDAPMLPVWDDPRTGTLDARARAWLEVNCAHCHNPKGPARNSGLHLNVDVTDRYQLGVFKTPVAAGKGTGGRNYGIVPGKPDESILLYRLETVEPGALMPEFGRTIAHLESIALIREWIKSMREPGLEQLSSTVPDQRHHVSETR